MNAPTRARRATCALPDWPEASAGGEPFAQEPRAVASVTTPPARDGSTPHRFCVAPVCRAAYVTRGIESLRQFSVAVKDVRARGTPITSQPIQTRQRTKRSSAEKCRSSPAARSARPSASQRRFRAALWRARASTALGKTAGAQAPSQSAQRRSNDVNAGAEHLRVGATPSLTAAAESDFFLHLAGLDGE
jgi:hypothetical protein